MFVDSTKPYLITDRFLLRSWLESDLPDLVNLDADPQVMQHINGGIPTSLEAVRASLLVIQDYEKRYNGELGNWIAIDRATSEFMGWFHLRPDKQNLDNRTRLELGYRLRRKFWGKGVATEISRALIAKAWEFGAKEVFARTHHSNLGSARVMEKIGMHLEAKYIDPVFVQDDKLTLLYSIRNPSISL
jgi:RimJ/RimL family protein N-acetyltransferase